MRYLSDLCCMKWSEVKATQSCPTLCIPMDCIVHGILQARILEWVAFPSPGDLPNPGIKPTSPILQVDSLSAEPQGSPRILEWAAYPFSNESSQSRNRTGVSCIAGGFFTNWSNFTPRYILKRITNKDSNRHLYSHVQCSIIHNSQNKGTIHMSNNRWTEKQNVLI